MAYYRAMATKKLQRILNDVMDRRALTSEDVRLIGLIVEVGEVEPRLSPTQRNVAAFADDLLLRALAGTEPPQPVLETIGSLLQGWQSELFTAAINLAHEAPPLPLPGGKQKVVKVQDTSPPVRTQPPAATQVEGARVTKKAAKKKTSKKKTSKKTSRAQKATKPEAAPEKAPGLAVPPTTGFTAARREKQAERDAAIDHKVYTALASLGKTMLGPLMAKVDLKPTHLRRILFRLKDRNAVVFEGNGAKRTYRVQLG